MNRMSVLRSFMAPRGSQNRRGFHKFQNIGKLEDFAMAPLKMRDFNCAYESLMVILYYNTYKELPPRLQ